MNEMKVSGLYIYPIKSLGAISLPSSVIDEKGLKHDRRFMLIDENGKFISQRTLPSLIRFHLSFLPDQSGIEILDKVSHLRKKLSFTPILGSLIDVQIWDDQVKAKLVEEDFSDFFSDLLEMPIRLVKLIEESPRIIKEKYQTNVSNQSSFADSLPILLCSEASVNDLAQKVGSFSLMRFRPNIVVSNDEAYVEDTWKEINIGEVKLFGAKPCARCNLVNVNPKSGVISKEILKGLSEYRNFGGKVYFGQQFVPKTLGNIKIGDIISVQQTKNATY
ncbi:MOSC domain-containing protein [Aquirufa sp. ROCK-SH2]